LARRPRRRRYRTLESLIMTLSVLANRSLAAACATAALLLIPSVS